MSQPITAVVGISGVGKTTLLKDLARRLRFQRMTAGSLIATAREAAGHADRDRLRLLDIDKNQRLLVAGFRLARDSAAPLVIVDGHVVIHAADGLHTIGSNVFAALGIGAMVHLAADPTRISANRAKDAARGRPQLSVDELERHQIASIAAATSVSKALDISLLNTSADDVGIVADFLIRLQS